MATCEYVVGFKADEEGENIGEIICGKPATHMCQGLYACAECVAVMRSCKEFTEDELGIRTITTPGSEP